MEISVADIIQDQKTVLIQSSDLPLACPMPNVALWDMHPKVYLALDSNNQALCPYCSTSYILTNEK